MQHSDEYQTITVSLDERGKDTTIRAFYCCVCGKFVCDIVGNVIGVTDGMPEESDRAQLGTRTIKGCRGYYFDAKDVRFRCNAKYIF